MIILNALTDTLSGQTVQFKSLSIGQGLSQATVTCMEQDDLGFVWVGTRDGLNRYDGYGFDQLKYGYRDSVSLTNNQITAICYADDGSLWVGTSFGLNRIDTRTLEITRYYQWFENEHSISSNKIRSIAEDRDGRIWIGTDNGLNRYDPSANKFIRYSIQGGNEKSLSNNIVNKIMVDGVGRIWVGTEGGLNLYNPQWDGFKRYRHEYEDDNSLSQNTVTALTEGEDGAIWIGTREGLNKFEPGFEIFSRYYTDTPFKGWLNSNAINSLTFDLDGTLWVGTAFGINRLWLSEGNSVSYRANPALPTTLPNDQVLCMLTDGSGMVWIGTQAAGIALIDKDTPQFNSVTLYNQAENNLEQNYVHSFLSIDSVNVWVGTGQGVALYNSLTAQLRFLNNPELDPLTSIKSSINDMLATEKDIWLATGGQGLVRYNKRTKQTKYYVASPDKLSLSGNVLSSLAFDNAGKLWIGTNGSGLCSMDTSSATFRTYRYRAGESNTLRDNNVHCVSTSTDGNVWIGTGNAGLYKLDQKTGVFTSFVAGKPSQASLPSNTINDLYFDYDGRLWIATSGGGLSYLDKNSKDFKTLSKEEGLANDVVLAVSQDIKGNIWISTNGGISTYNLSSNQFRNYSQNDVLGKNTFFPKSILQTENGLIYFGGSNGFDFFNTEGLRSNTFISPVAFTGYQLLDEPVGKDIGILPRNLFDTLLLDYNHSGFLVEFAALNFRQSHKNQYSYRLDGLFDQWRYLGNKNFITFSTLFPGNYVLEIRGSNNDGVWNEEPVRMVIVVRPAFWQTMWFQFLSALAILGTLYLAYRYRVGSEKLRTQELESAVKMRTTEIARERDTNAILLKEVHHRVKNNLQIIVSLLSLQSRFINDDGQLRVFGEVQNRVRSMSLIHQKMYQTKDLQTVNIEEYITDLSNSLLRTYQLAQEIELDVDVQVNRFNADTLTPLGLIINEVISNSLKYAFEQDKPGKIFVRLTKEGENQYQLIIGDNGVGMPGQRINVDSNTFGSELIVALTEQLNGTIELLPEYQGTVYKISFEDAAA